MLPLSIFRIKGLTATDASQVLGIAGFFAAFFFVTLYMQEILHFSALRAGSAYLPITVIIAVGSIGGSGIIPRIGTRPLIVGGAVIATGGLYWLSRIPPHGHYWTDIFPPMMITGLGLGLVFVAVQIAGNAGVPADKAGLAGALINASFQLGEALGLAILSAHAAVNGSRPRQRQKRRRRSDEGLADVKDSQERADLPGYPADVGHRVAGSPDSRGGWRTTESAPAPASTPTSPPTASPGNDLTDHLLQDELSGTSAMNGVPVTVEAAQPIPAPS